MASNKRTVQIDIRARDEASRALDTVSKSLDELTAAQQGLATSAAKTDGVLGGLTDEINKLNAEVKGLDAFGTIVGELNKASGALGKLEGEAAQNAEEVRRLDAAYRAAIAATQALRQSAALTAAAYQQQKDALAASRTELTNSNKAVKTAESEYKKLSAAVASAAAPSAQLVQQLRNQAFALNDARQRQATATLAVTQNTEALRIAKGEHAAMQASVRGLAAEERKLQTQLDSATASLARAQSALVNQETTLYGIGKGAAQASAAMGGLAAEEGAIAQATQKANAQLAEANRLQQQLTRTAPTAQAPTGADAIYRQQAQAVRESIAAVKAAQEEVKKLGQANRNAAQPTAILAAQFAAAKQQLLDARAAAASARSSFEALRGSTAGGFQVFAANEAAKVREVRDSLNQIGQTGAQGVLARMREALRGFTSSLAPAATGVDKVSTSVRKLGEDSRRSLSLVQRLRGQILSLAAGYVGFQAAISQAGGVITAFQTMEAASSRLGVVFNQNTGRISQELEFLQRTAARLGIEFGVLSDEYGKFAVAAQAANFTNEETRKLFLSVAEAARVNKLSVDQTRGVFLALNQMISKGKVSSEELRRQLGDRLAGAFNIFASALGLTTAELDKQMKAGEVYADRSTMLKFADELNKRFGPQLQSSLSTVTTEIGKFRNEVMNAQLRVGQGGFMESLRVALVEINKAFKSREGRDFFLSLGAVMGKVVDLFVVLGRNIDTVVAVLRVFIAFKAANYFLSLGESVARAGLNFGVLTANVAKTNAQMKALSGRAVIDALRGGVAGAVTSMKALLAATVQVRTATTAATAQMNLFGATTGVAATRMGILRGATVAARGAMALLVGSVRTLVAAFGGWIGIILTGVITLGSYLAGKWASNVDDATTAIDEHKRIMQEVVTQYEQAAKGADKFKGSVEGISASQVGQNLAKQRDILLDYKKQLQSGALASNFKLSALSAPEGAAASFVELNKALVKGEVSLEDYRAKLQEVYKQADEGDTGLRERIAKQAELTDKIIAQKQVVGEAAVVAEKYGQATAQTAKEAKDAGVSMETLANGVQETNNALDPSAVTAYQEALTKLKESVPGLKDEMERLADVDALGKARDTVLNSTVATEEDKKAAADYYGKAIKAVTDKAIKDIVNDDLVASIVQNESGGRNIRNTGKGQTASGIGQFTNDTWLRVIDKYFSGITKDMSREQKLALKNNSDLQREAIAALARENLTTIQKMGVTITEANAKGIAGLAHFAGGERAGRLLQANPNTPASQFFSKQEIDVNKSVLGGKSVGEVLAYFEKRNALTSEELKIRTDIDKLETEEAQRQADYIEEFNARLESKKEELNALKESTREYAGQKAVEEELARARKANVTLTQQQLDDVRNTAQALFDVKTAEANRNALIKKTEESTRNVLKLEEERKTLLEQFRTALTEGDTASMTEIEARVTAINAELPIATENARAFAAEMAKLSGEDGLNGQKMLDDLNKVDTSLKQVNKDFFEGKQISEQLAQGGASAFDQFSASIANGVGVIASLKQAFLQFASDFLRQIAQMIFQQTIFTALQSQGGGGSVAGVFNSVLSSIFHRGGVVGSGGAPTRAVNPAWFSGAKKFHDGGLPGLAPSEVPAILKKGEEVLTNDDPRNILNGGLGGGKQDIKVINTIDAGDFVSQGMNSKVGEKAVLNFIRANATAVRNAMQG